jgi:inorganic pyrophosphatase
MSSLTDRWAHPTPGRLEYPLNYGFIPGTLSGDDEPIDAYVLGETEPLTSYRGRCVAVIQRLEETDDKAIVVGLDAPEPSDDEVESATAFQERFTSAGPHHSMT